VTGVYALTGGWLLAAASAFIVGLSKTGIPGLPGFWPVPR
jgi:hypothetical protein